MAPPRKDPVLTWWANVDRSGGPDACWPWSAGRDRSGYGKIQAYTADDRRRRSVRAHRFGYELLVGPIPDGLMLCHTCDNPPCCNPTHLYPGTAKDNAADMLARMRASWQQRTHCPYGHPYEGDNLIVMRTRGLRARVCRTCRHWQGYRARTIARGEPDPGPTPADGFVGRPQGRHPLENFIQKIDMSGPNECWLWTAAADRDGVGKFSVSLPGNKQRHVRARRFAFETFIRPLEAGEIVLVRCNTPSCVNPAHLTAGLRSA